jgi:hypothetical protein
MTINYEYGIDYGYEVNYLIYNYMIYFQNTNNQRLFGNVPSDNVYYICNHYKMKKLKKRWGIESNLQLAVIFICNHRLYVCMGFKTCLFVARIVEEDFGNWFCPY